LEAYSLPEAGNLLLATQEWVSCERVPLQVMRWAHQRVPV